MTYSAGDPVIWLHTTRGGWNWTIRVKATVVKATAKRVTIDAHMRDGSTVRKSVKPENLERVS